VDMCTILASEARQFVHISTGFVAAKIFENLNKKLLYYALKSVTKHDNKTIHRISPVANGHRPSLRDILYR
jgi:hypothetical protein